ncbi:MAG TPA: hypothetical protein EYP59_00695, partial [Thiotrichaceae bacterium]|nr:hypothetical protein [Thiotrichaceae bacterium]
MNSNPLPPIWQAYKTAQDSFRIAKRAIKTEYQPARQRLLQRTEMETQSITEAECLLEKSNKESDALFVLALWATFERFMRDDLQKRGQILCQTNPPDLGTSIYEHFEKEVEFWKPVEILDFLKKRLFKTQPDLIGHAKQVLAYRDWVAHGKNPKKLPSATQHPKDVFNTLNEIVETLLRYPPSSVEMSLNNYILYFI